MLTLAPLFSKGIGATFHSNNFRVGCSFCRYVFISENQNGIKFHVPELLAFVYKRLTNCVTI